MIKHIASVHEEYSKGPEGFHGIISDTKNTIEKFDFTVIDDINVKDDMKFIIRMVQEGKETFKCELCEKIFPYKSNLKIHVESVHEKKKPFKCNICQYTFFNKKRLAKHIESVHA